MKKNPNILVFFSQPLVFPIAALQLHNVFSGAIIEFIPKDGSLEFFTDDLKGARK